MTGYPNATVLRYRRIRSGGQLTACFDTRAGSLLVFPYYTSTISNTYLRRNSSLISSTATLSAAQRHAHHDSNISNAASTVANQAHAIFFLIDGATSTG
ncbi:MAG: hypothetical protein U0Y68_24255 [Blastocatellia bacterium]